MAFDYPFFQIRGSVIRRVYIQVICILVYVSIIACLYNIPDIKDHFKDMKLPNNFLSIISVVLGMILVFRTNTAYERYWEGRKIWGQTVTGIRNLSRFVWVHSKADLSERKALVHLMIAFALSIKHYLRDEKTELALSVNPYLHKKKKKPKYEDLPEEKEPVLLVDKSESELSPLILLHQISSVFGFFKSKDLIDVQIWAAVQAAVGSLVDAISGFERIRTTPLPIAYSLHLSHTVWIYLLFLPFQILDYKWVVIPVCGITAFCFLGMESLGREIENPFGYDANDLPMDDLCEEVKKELDGVLAQEPFNVVDWLKDLN